MRSPASLALLLLVAPLLACFADGGSTTVATSAGLTTGSGEPGTTGAAGTSGAASTGEASTTQAGTEGSTGASSTAPTTGTPSTGAADNCELAPECAAGVVEDGEQCDSCGVQRRTCQADCSWGPMACEEDLETCAYWRLPAGQGVWQRVAVEPGAAFAPKEAVVTAIALAPQQQIFVLTASSYHVLDAGTQQWVAAGNRDEVFPALAGRTLRHGSSLTAYAPDTIVHLVADADVLAFTFVADDNDFRLDLEVPCCGPHWVGVNTPPDPLLVRAGYGKLGNDEGWIPGDVQALCPDQMPPELFGYGLAIGDGFVYPYDVGYCADFYSPIPYDEFPPFTYPGRPANDLVAGAAWLDGLWIFR